MATVSFDQFVKQSGATSPEQVKTLGVNKLPEPQKPTIGSKIKDAFKSGISQYKSGEAEIAESLDSNVGFGKGLAKLGEGTLKAAAGAVNAASAPLAPIFEPISKGVDYVADKISDIPAVQKFAGTKAGEVTEQVAENVANASTVAGAAASVAGGLKPRVKGMIERLPEPEVTATKVGETPNNYVSRKLYETAIGRTTDEAERVLRARADKLLGKETLEPTTRATTAQKYGIAGRQTEIGVKAKATGEKLFQKEILPEIQKSDAVVTKNDLFTPIIEKINKVVDPSRKAELQDAFDAIIEEYDGVEQWDLETAQKLKSECDRFTHEE